MSITYKIAERFMRRMNISKAFEEPEDIIIKGIKEKWRADDMPGFVYKKTNARKEMFEGRPLFTISGTERKNNRAILFLHGGGGILCPTVLHYRTVVTLARGTGSEVYFPFYPLAPENSVSESLEWIEKVYALLASRYSPEDITVIGDSAGAMLGAALLERLEKKPSGLILISPGLSITDYTDKLAEIEKKDVVMSIAMVKFIEKHWGSGKGSIHLSPDKVDYTGFPPIMLFYGTSELFYIGINNLIKRINKYNIPLMVNEGKGLCHDWAIDDFYPEGRRAMRKIVKFCKR